jgi:hypothetical protein
MKLLVSSLRPVKLPRPVKTAPRTPVASRDSSVPSMATPVRALTPCERYSVTIMMAAAVTTAIVSGSAPPSSAGRVKKASSSSETPRLASEPRPRHRDSTRTPTTNTPTSSASGSLRSKSRNW